MFTPLTKANPDCFIKENDHDKRLKTLEEKVEKIDQEIINIRDDQYSKKDYTIPEFEDTKDALDKLILKPSVIVQVIYKGVLIKEQKLFIDDNDVQYIKISAFPEAIDFEDCKITELYNDGKIRLKIRLTRKEPSAKEECDCDLSKPMTEGEAEIAKDLGNYLNAEIRNIPDKKQIIKEILEEFDEKFEKYIFRAYPNKDGLYSAMKSWLKDKLNKVL